MKTATRGTTTTVKKNEYLPYIGSDKETEVAVYYGFVPIQSPEVAKIDRDNVKTIGGDSGLRHMTPGAPLFIRPEEKIALLRTYEGKNIAEGAQAVMVYYRGDVYGEKDKRKNPHEKCFCLDILGSSKSIAEATIIQTTLEMLREEGFSDLYVDINSIGDKDSMARFLRELTAYYKKHTNELSARCRELLKRNPAAILECDEEKCIALNEEAPKAIAYLSETARIHFKEVLEYLETLDIPYRINHSLIGNRNFMNFTVFQVKTLGSDDDTSAPLAVGFRYNGLAKKIGQKRDIPGVGVTLLFKRSASAEKAHLAHKVKKPKMFFAQIGFDAKLKSLKIIEMLRKARIPLYQSLSKDKMASQILVAENLKIPYIMIMGQKEAMENTVIVRNMATRSQETIKIPTLAEYLKKIS